MKNCPFCSVGGRVITENQNAFVLLSNPRKVPGHILVIPKRHIEEPWKLTHEELTDIFDLIYDVEQKIIGKLGDGCDVRQNYRPFKEQSKLKVNHVHFHVIPRYNEDYLYMVSEQFETDLFAELDPSEAREVAKLLK